MVKKYTKEEVVKALRDEVKAWDKIAEEILAFDALDMDIPVDEVEERNKEYQHAREWQNALACVAFEIENGHILE